MKRPTLKRMVIGFAQHFLAACILLAAARLLLNAYIEVESIDGTKVYRIFPTDGSQEFDESEVYNDLFRNAVSDITQLVVIKGQLEKDGVFSPQKRIDVTEYANMTGVDKGCEVTAVYELDDLIRWGKYGVEYTVYSMSLSEFVNYFGYIIYPENFTLDEYDQLCFDGVYRLGENTPDTGVAPEGGGEPANYGKSVEEVALIREKMDEREFSGEQFEDIVFAHIMAQYVDNIEVYHDEDRKLMVSFSLLDCRYAPVTGEKELIRHADNWVDYMRLQENLVASIQALDVNYQRYLLCNEAYSEENSNVKYMVRMMTDEGMCTYTNLSQIREMSDEEVTDFFSEYRRYLIYYPDGLIFMGNTVMSEEEVYEYVKSYEFAYPDTTHIWMGIDTNYTVQSDAFYKANSFYEEIVPNVGRIIFLAVFLAILWLAVVGYLTVTAGVTIDEKGGKTRYLNRFDHVWTELLLLLAAGAVYGGMLGFRMIMNIAENAGTISAELLGARLTTILRYGAFALYGVYLSLAVSVVWYSLVRRLKLNSLWSDSFLRGFFVGFGKAVRFIFRNRNSVINTLLPYIMLLLINFAGAAAMYQYRERLIIFFAALGGIVIFDVIAGGIVFKRGAERNEIVEGINRIRDGEVDFKLDTERLHGTNRELADAVNNIGEGIRKAVRTSLKDEQMKTDLITNVSHDIKTPLTSIVNYVDLLKRLNITDRQARDYIEILDSKAKRLKQLTDDLVEASKISSGNLVLNMEKLNLTELINQGIGEFSEKLEAGGLQVIFDKRMAPAYVYADSRRMWRVVENLLNNICNYAMEGTRVYIDIAVENKTVEVFIKNISKQQMNIRPEELTERFIRGDSARSTEGSGLGLSIARSLTEVQGGEFEIFLDGDLFKVMLRFSEYQEPMLLPEKTRQEEAAPEDQAAEGSGDA